MRHTEVAIVGGGLAGATAAAMLGRAGFGAVLIDPRPAYPPDFRCEKLDASQLALLHKTGLADQVLPTATRDGEVWIARFGRLVEKRPSDRRGIRYEALVNTVRAAIPPSVAFVEGKVSAVSTSPDRQRVALANGDEISARLVVMANGLNHGLRQAFGIGRVAVSLCHSISIGFDMVPVGRQAFAFPALTYYPERTTDRVAYLTLFPVGTAMRANLFVYWDMNDPRLRGFRHDPRAAMAALMPRLAGQTGDFEIAGSVKIRPVDLSVSTNHRQPGMVLVGDAFATSCPAAGTGVNKVLTDVERLCNVHIPRWLATEGMDEGKIAGFYDDPVKSASDAASTTKAYFLRSLSTEGGVSWRARRWGRFMGQFGIGMLRETRERLAVRSPEPHRSEAAQGGGRA